MRLDTPAGPVRLRPHDRLSHASAALVYGAPLPRSANGGLHISAPLESAKIRRTGVISHRDTEPRQVVRGIPVSGPETLFVELGETLAVDDLVAIGDFLVLDPRFREPGRPWTTIGALQTATRAKRRGVVRAREALELVRDGVESPMETALRLMLLREGLPEPVCGYELVTSRREWVGWFDLAWPEARVLGEYDGDEHRTSDVQYERDIRRYDLAHEDGWRTVRVRKAGMRRANRAETVARFRRALAAARR